MDLLGVITTMVVYMVTHLLFGPLIDRLRCAISSAITPVAARMDDELTALRVRYHVWILSHHATRPAVARGMSQLMISFAYWSYGRCKFVDGDLADPIDFERSVRMAVLRSRNGAGKLGPEFRDLIDRLNSLLRALAVLCRTEKSYSSVRHAVDRLTPHLLGYQRGGHRMRPEMHARVTLIIHKSLFARGRPLYFPQIRAQLRMTFMSRSERSVLVRKISNPEEGSVTFDDVYACIIATALYGDESYVIGVQARVEDVVRALAGGRRLEPGSLLHRVVDRNLDRIKQRLWRPDGRLASQLVRKMNETANVDSVRSE